MSITHAFAADITKAERDANGDLIVYGKATGPDVDLDEQVCDPTWLKAAMPAWMEWGNLREMHQPIAAGVGLELEQQGDDYFVKSRVVDENTARKIEAGALKGYSVGIKNARVVKDGAAPGGRIVGGDIVEVSYVDRPCNPTATLAIAKAVGADDTLAPVEAEDADEDQEQAADAAKTITINITGGSIRSDRDLVNLIQKHLLGDRRQRDADDRAKAIAILDKAVGPDGQIDEAPDIEGGRQAIALIAKLIKAEADELAAGEMGETLDIELLVRAVDLLKCWLAKEQAADAGTDTGATDGVTYVGLDAEPDTVKRDFSSKERDQAADSGAAMKDGSFPIKNKSDLQNAIRAVGRAKDPAAAKAHIKRRARALGATDMIPDDWKDVEPDVTKTTGAAPAVSKDELEQLVKGAVTEATKAAQERIDALAAELAKVKATPLPGGPVVTAATPRQHTASTNLGEAAYYERMADQITDPRAAAGYRQKAVEARRAAGQSQ